MKPGFSYINFPVGHISTLLGPLPSSKSYVKFRFFDQYVQVLIRFKGGSRERVSNTTGILPKKKTMWFIGVEVEQETSAPPPKKNPGSAPAFKKCIRSALSYLN